jgi:hypothetical protein
MARRLVPKYTKPFVITLEELREAAQDMLERARGDEEKAGEISDWVYYEGYADALEYMLKWMTGEVHDENEPQAADEADKKEK